MNLLRNPRIWIYLVVGIAAAGLIWYDQWRNSDEQRLKRCVEASISEMMQSNPELAEFDNAGPIFDSMARPACKKRLGIN
jgi:hypothetical protein